MARRTAWHDDYWLPLMQIYLRQPVGVKPLYHHDMVDLSLELHISPEALRGRMRQIAQLKTPRIERIWHTYSQNPQRLARAVRLLRSMKGFGDADTFYDGVEVQETFERDFRPMAENPQLLPVMLVIILGDLYFQLTPATMEARTPEVADMARLLRVGADDVVQVLEAFLLCDPYLQGRREQVVFSPLLLPCQQVWQRFAEDHDQLARQSQELRVYFSSNER